MVENMITRSYAVLVLVQVPLAIGAVVLALLAGVEHGGLLWWAFGLVTVGSLVFLGSAARGRFAVLGVGLVVGAAAVSGWVVWHTRAGGGYLKLLGAGAPSTLTAAGWLLVVLVVVLMAVTMLRRKEITGISGRSWCVLLAVAAAVAGVAGTGAWLAGRGLAALRTDMIMGSGIEHTVDASADPVSRRRVGAVTGPRQWQKSWQQPAAHRTVVGTTIAGLAVSATIAADDQSGIAVLDSRTGTERWHFRTDHFGVDDAVAVSPSADRVLVLLGATAILLDLDSGTEVDRFVLPELSAGPTLGLTRYQILGPRSHDRTFGEQPQVEITGETVHIAVTGAPGPTDVLTVNLNSGRLSTLAAGLPQFCRFRVVRPNEYVNGHDLDTWLLRDGAGCGTPTLTKMFRGRPLAEVTVPQVCDPHGCELLDAYATDHHIVVQTSTELLTLDTLGAVQARGPMDRNRRSVILPNGATPAPLPPGAIPRTNTVFAQDGAVFFQYRATSPDSGQLVRVDTTTGQESPPSETVRCAEPTTLSIAADVLILSCGTEVTAFG